MPTQERSVRIRHSATRLAKGNFTIDASTDIQGTAFTDADVEALRIEGKALLDAVIESLAETYPQEVIK